jgi:hypothetical protein
MTMLFFAAEKRRRETKITQRRRVKRGFAEKRERDGANSAA